MGMTVPEFMSVLGYSSCTTEQNNCNSGSFVWPKHTELEVRDPWSAVYQYEPSDVSWCIRFKALGCYNFIPPPLTNRLSKVPTTPTLSSNYDKSPLKIDQASPNCVAFPTLQTIHPSSEKSTNLPLETITLAERHKLWEDLLLSDSEEENEEKSRLPGSLRTSSRTVALKTPAAEDDILSKLGDKSTSARLSILDHALRPPPPFVSPLPVLHYDGSRTESFTPITHIDVMPLSQIDGGNKQDSTISSGHISDAPTESAANKCEKSLLLSASRPSPVNKILLTDNPSGTHHPNELITSIPVNDSSENNFSNRLATVTCNVGTKITSVSKPILVLNDESNCNRNIAIKPRTDIIMNAADDYCNEHCDDPKTRRSFIQRLLLESGEFLNQKDSLITELSPIHYNDRVNLPTKLSKTDEEKSVSEHKSENTISSSNTNRTPSNSQINYCRPSQQECTLTDGKSVTPEKLKIMSQQSLLLHDHQKDIQKADAQSEDRTSKLSSVSVTHEAFEELPSNRDYLSNLLGSVDQDAPSATNLCPGLAKQSTRVDKELSVPYTNQISERKKNISDAQMPISNMVKSRCHLNNTSNMPPPTHDPTGKKLKKRSRYSTKSTVPKGLVAAYSSELSSSIHEQAQNESNDKEDIDSVSLVQITQETTGIYPLRDIPTNCWIFSDLTVTKVRNKIQQSFSRSLNSSPIKKEEVPSGFSPSKYHLIKKMRNILRDAAENDSLIISRTNQSRRNRPRSLTGILLVPPFTLTESSEAKLSPHLADEPSPHKSYHDIYTMTSPYFNQTTTLNDVDVQCDIWPSCSNNNLISNRFVSQCSGGIVSTPTQKPLGTVPPILRDPVCDLTNLSSNIAQNLPQLSGQSLSCMNLSYSLLFMEEQFGRIIKQENEKLQNSNASTEIFKAEECKFEASKCWKALVNAISSCSRDNSSEAPNRSYMLLNLQALHEYPVQMTKSVRHYLASAYIFESKNEILRAIDMLTEATNQIQHCVRRMHRVEAKLTKHRSHRTETENSLDVNELAMKIKRDAGWMYLWYYVFMRIKAVIGFHIYRLKFQSIDSLRKDIDTSLSVVKQHIPSLNDSINLPNVFESPSEKLSSIKPKVARISSSESENLKVLESLIVQFVRFNQLTTCVHNAMIEWQQADELVTKVPHLKSSPVGRKSENSVDMVGYTSFSGHLRPIHSIDIDIASASEGAYINTSQIPILILLRYMDGIFHVHPLIIDQLKCPGHESVQPISLKYSSSEIWNPTTVSQEPKLTLSTDSSSLPSMVLSAVSRTPNIQQQSNSFPQSTFQTTEISNTNFHSEPPNALDTGNGPPKRKCHKKQHSSGSAPLLNSVSSSIAKPFTPHHSSALDENSSDVSIPSSKHDISQVPKRKSKKRRLLQADESTDVLHLPVDASSTNTDTDLDSYGRSSAVNDKRNESPEKMSQKSKTVRKVEDPESVRFEIRKPDPIDNSNSQEHWSHTSRHPFSKKKSKRSHTHTQHSNHGVTSHSRRIIASDDQSPSASPPPTRKLCRSKSVAPPTAPKFPPDHTSAHTKVHDINVSTLLEDNTYQPKRIKPSYSKVHRRRISNSQSPESESFPTPTYKPSVPVDSPDDIKRHNQQRRRSRSVHLSSSRRKHTSLLEASDIVNNPSELSSHDSLGYSPTKRSLIGGGASSVPDVSSLPVYHVSQIPPSPPSKSQHNRSGKNQNESIRSKSPHHPNNPKSHSSTAKSSSEVPSFYARWIKEPLSNADRFSSISSNNNNIRKYQEKW
ncbi:cement precursor 3B variant 2 [Schistosoma japonicum]|nr:cement precursor 3B variant 2 [Schistosoma japonicum]